MKNFIIFLCLCVSVCFVCCSETDSCKIAEVYSTESEPTLFKNPYDFVGELHNMAMDSILLNKVPLSSVKEYSYTFINRHKDMLFEVDEICGREEFICFAEQIDIKGYNHSSKELTRGQMNAQLDSLILSFPISCRAHLRSMVVLIDSHINDTSIINSSFSQLDHCIFHGTNLTNTEKSILLSISSIAKSSYKYNLEDYCDKIIRLGQEYGIEEIEGWDLNPENIYSFDRWSVLESDCLGAIFGGVQFIIDGGLAASTVFGPGGVVLGGATMVACGAVYSSGASIVGAVSGSLWNFFN